MQTCTTTTNDGPHDFAISEVQRMQGLNVKHPRNITISIECIHCIIYLHRNLQNWLVPTSKTNYNSTHQRRSLYNPLPVTSMGNPLYVPSSFAPILEIFAANSMEDTL
mmetsp:Transcript_33491/g.60048  ORF Transcript_33491/g.60048 Transcript_33491/m.60048 type:complete len:108 (+) Transcript_33491:328-651(+)